MCVCIPFPFLFLVPTETMVLEIIPRAKERKGPREEVRGRKERSLPKEQTFQVLAGSVVGIPAHRERSPPAPAVTGRPLSAARSLGPTRALLTPVLLTPKPKCLATFSPASQMRAWHLLGDPRSSAQTRTASCLLGGAQGSGQVRAASTGRSRARFRSEEGEGGLQCARGTDCTEQTDRNVHTAWGSLSVPGAEVFGGATSPAHSWSSPAGSFGF